MNMVKIYRPAIEATTEKVVMVVEEPHDMLDDTDRCVLLDDYDNRIRELFEDFDKVFNLSNTQLKKLQRLQEKYKEELKRK